MVEQDFAGYSPLVAQLLTHGPATLHTQPEDWFDYVGHYGLGEENLPELISLAGGVDIDSEKPYQLDARVHACRALGQIGDPGADLFLVKLIDDGNDLLTESVWFALSMLGLPGLKALEWYFNWTDTDMWGQVEAVHGISTFAQRHPQYRSRCVAFLTEALANGKQLDAMVNGFIVYDLVQLQAVESSATIEQAFDDGYVDEDVIGRWADVQVELGLASVADFEPGELLYPEDKSERALRPAPAPRRSLQVETAGSYSILHYLQR